jgi:hypothetical protein
MSLFIFSLFSPPTTYLPSRDHSVGNRLPAAVSSQRARINQIECQVPTIHPRSSPVDSIRYRKRVPG